MDWTTLGSWALDKGPFLAVIGVQARIILKLLDRFFVQQAVLTDAMTHGQKALDHAENHAASDV